MSAQIIKTFGRNPIMCIDKATFKNIYESNLKKGTKTFSNTFGRNPIMLINDKVYKNTALFKSNPFFYYVPK
jgi:hypothetical protein